MTSVEALSLLDKVCASVALNRETHVKVQQAVEVIRKAITGKPENKKK